MQATLPLHPRNHAFTWSQPDRPPARLSSELAQGYARDGYFILADAFDAAEMAAVIAAIDPFEAQAEAALREREGGRHGISRAGEITFRPHLVKESTVLREFSRHPVFTDLVYDLIGDDVRLYWDQSVYKKPGTPKEFPWHQDNGYTFIEPQQYLTCWVALTAATIDNGCPWVVPGVHRLGTLEHTATDLGWRCLTDPPDAVPLPLDAGSIAVFSSLTPHRTGPNLTDDVRKAYILQYAPDGVVMLRDGDPPLNCDAQDRQYFVLKGGVPA